MTNGSMTKAELVGGSLARIRSDQEAFEVIVDTVFRSIIEALHRGEKDRAARFGSFRLRKREPRKEEIPRRATRWTCAEEGALLRRAKN
jgi:integration host factor subunit beta